MQRLRRALRAVHARVDLFGSSAFAVRVPSPSRRSLSVVAVAVLVLSAGCTGGLGGDEGATVDAPVGFVPEDAEAVVAAGGGVVTDEATATLYEELVGPGDSAGLPATWAGVLEAANDETDLDLEGLESAVAFSQSPNLVDAADAADIEDVGDAAEVDPDDLGELDAADYAAVAVESDWTWPELSEALRTAGFGAGFGEVEFEEDSYEGVTVYRVAGAPEAGLVADLGDGAFVIGATAAVEDAIDTDQSEASGFGGDLRDAYDAADDGLVKAAVAPELGDATVGSSVGLEQPEVITVVYDTDGTEMTADAMLTMPSTDAAEQTADGLNFLITGLTTEAPEDDPLAELVSKASVGQSGNDVTVSYTAEAAELGTLLEELAQREALIGAAGEDSASDAPA